MTLLKLGTTISKEEPNIAWVSAYFQLRCWFGKPAIKEDKASDLKWVKYDELPAMRDQLFIALRAYVYDPAMPFLDETSNT